MGTPKQTLHHAAYCMLTLTFRSIEIKPEHLKSSSSRCRRMSRRNSLKSKELLPFLKPGHLSFCSIWDHRLIASTLAFQTAGTSGSKLFQCLIIFSLPWAWFQWFSTAFADFFFHRFPLLCTCFSFIHIDHSFGFLLLPIFQLLFLIQDLSQSFLSSLFLNFVWFFGGLC